MAESVVSIDVLLESEGHEAENNPVMDLSEFDELETCFAEEAKPKLSLHEAADNGEKEEVLKILHVDVRKINDFDEKGWAALHYAAYNNHLSVAETLLLNDADPEVKTNRFKTTMAVKGSTALHLVAGKGHDMAAMLLLDPNKHLQQIRADNSIQLKPADVNSENSKKQTPLHLASLNGHLKTVTILLKCGAEVNKRDDDGMTPMHDACSPGHGGVVKILLENGARESINDADKRTKSPLHYACRTGNVELITDLLKNGAQKSINLPGNLGKTPLHEASEEGNLETIAVLLKHGADVNKKDNDGQNVLHFACFWGNVELLKMLLSQETANLEEVDNDGNNPLMVAILEGYGDIVKAILMKFDNAATRKLFMSCNNDNTTPLREAIRRIPDVAAMMLDCCTEPVSEFSNNSEDYSVDLHYGILEDFQDSHNGTSSRSSVQEQSHSHGKLLQFCVQRCVEKLFPDDGDFTSTWGPVGFDHKNHPLNLIAQSENLKLLKHPLVTYLLKRKWKVTRVIYLIGLVFYCIFLIFLTAYALTVPSPLRGSCKAVFRGAFGNASAIDNCELSDSRKRFIFTAAIFVVIAALIRLLSEVFQMCQHKIYYFTDLVNWMELLMAVFAIIFGWVFNTDCLCTYRWQWQIGTIAVFLAWFDFIIFVQKLPAIGIYVAMLRDILWRFIKTIPLATMLVIAFALGFFMLFSEPDILRSPFSTPARALLTMVAYSTGGFNYNSLFRLTPGGTEEDNEVEEIPFPPVSYILFIIFLIVMPILLSNLLTALAVGDTGKILQNAEAKNIALKIQLILSVDAILPAKLRRKFIVGEEWVYPNEDLSLMEKLQKKLKFRAALPKGIEISEVLKREDNSLKSLMKKTLTLMKDAQEMKRCQKDMKQAIQTMQEDMATVKGLLQKLVANKEQTQEAAGESDSSGSWI